MKTYELTYIVSPEITSEEATAKAKELETAITNGQGIVLKQSNPIARVLSYPIEKHASGFFGTLEFQLEPEKLAVLKEILEKDGKIVRHMLIIKTAAQMRKEKRTRTKPGPEAIIEEIKPASAPKSSLESREKVELKDIEHELDELLSE